MDIIEAEATTSQVTDDSGHMDEALAQGLTPEQLQRKLYFLLENLKQMHSKLPE